MMGRASPASRAASLNGSPRKRAPPIYQRLILDPCVGSSRFGSQTELTKEVEMARLSADPVKQALDDRCIKELSRRLAERFGTNASSECRHLERIHTGNTRFLQERTAERIAAAMGYHLLELWPDWR
jgi:hypothetical protein